MTAGQARAAAREWMAEKAGRIRGFRAAYSAGSTNWLTDDAELATGSDVDILVVAEGDREAGRRKKFRYRDALLEVSFLRDDELQPDRVLRDYHLAPSLYTTQVLFDPFGRLAPLRAEVMREYARRRRVRERCANARDKVLAHLRSIDEQAPLHDQAIACLFAAGVTTHVLLVAGLCNPTIRARYVAVRKLLAGYGQLAFHEALLELLGTAALERARVEQHVAAAPEMFDAACGALRTWVPFAADITAMARASAIDGSAEPIARGLHREAMFWVAVTQSRCQKVFATDAPALAERFHGSYLGMLRDLGIATAADIRRRREEIEAVLPRVWEVAEQIIDANREIGSE